MVWHPVDSACNFLILYALAFIDNNLFNYLHHLFYFFFFILSPKMKLSFKKHSALRMPTEFLSQFNFYSLPCHHGILQWKRSEACGKGSVLPKLCLCYLHHPWIPSISTNPQTLHCIYTCWSAADACMFHMTPQILISTRCFKLTV